MSEKLERCEFTIDDLILASKMRVALAKAEDNDINFVVVEITDKEDAERVVRVAMSIGQCRAFYNGLRSFLNDVDGGKGYIITD